MAPAGYDGFSGPVFQPAYAYAEVHDINVRLHTTRRRVMNNMNDSEYMKYDMQSNPIPDPLADPNRDPEADPLSPPSPGHRPEEPQHPDAPPDGHPV
jgi:hypothetical protein